jgi:hypothetical protein
MDMIGTDWTPFRLAFPLLFGGDYVISLWIGAGWGELAWTLCERLEAISEQSVAEGHPPIHILQIKESDGGLRVLLAHPTEEANALVRAAEAASLGVCECCGEPGELFSVGGWEKTLCARHAAPGTF